MNIIQIYKKFPTEKSCVKYLEQVRWNNGPVCPYCKSENNYPMPKELRHHCNECCKSFSVMVGTIFYHTKCDLRKWFIAITMVLNAKKGISARQLGRDLEVSKDTAWYMIMRIRKAFNEQCEAVIGVYELDEVFIGGKTTNKHRWEREILNEKDSRGQTTKNIVFGVLHRGGNVSCMVVLSRNREDLMPIIDKKIPQNSTIVTDSHHAYFGLNKKHTHIMVNHEKEEFVKGKFHTNSIEGFWAILKRGVYGQFHKISARYLDRYLNEFCFRYNNRSNKNVFDLTVQKALFVC